MKSVEWAFSVLTKFMSDKSFGELTFTVQNGEVVNIKTTKSEKPPIDNNPQK